MKRFSVIRHVALTAFLGMSALTSQAELPSDLVGYTIVGSFTISGYQDENGKTADDFEGCEFGRTIIFSNDKVLHCRGYRYHYAYRPTALVLVNGSNFKMIVNDDVYDMAR